VPRADYGFVRLPEAWLVLSVTPWCGFFEWPSLILLLLFHSDAAGFLWMLNRLLKPKTEDADIGR
jgi:hypothetical protein